MKRSRLAFVRIGAAIVIGALCLYGCENVYSEASADMARKHLRQWGTPVQIFSSTYSSKPQIAMDSKGNGMAVWQYRDSSNINYIQACRHVPGQGWGEVTTINTPSATAVNSPQTAMDSSGNAIAVWFENDGYIYTNSFSPGTGWLGEEKRNPASYSSLSDPVISMNSSGNALICYRAQSTSWEIYAIRFISGTGWTGATTFGSSDGNSRAQGDIDSNNNCTVVWGGSDNIIHARRCNAAGSWDATDSTFGNFNSSSRISRIGTDSSGNAMVLWNYSGSIYVNLYISGWQGAQKINFTSSGASPQLDMNGSGDAMAVWIDNNHVMTRRYSSTSGSWDASATEIGPTGSGQEPFDPQIAMDPEGNTVAVWKHSSSLSDYFTYYNTYSPGTGWNTWNYFQQPELDSENQQVAFSSNGSAIVVWQHDYSIYAACYE
jgi:hypothetical protein